MSVDVEFPAALFHSCLSPTDSSTAVRFQAAITQAAGRLAVEAFRALDVDDYASLGRCERELLASPSPVPVSGWGGPDDDRIRTEYEESVWRVHWSGHRLYVVTARWNESFNSVQRSWVVAESREIAHAFALDVARVTNDPRETILVFSGGCWQRSRELWRATQEASFDELVLAQALKERIRADFRRFLNARSSYDALGVAWRRGALFLGPPGNGKTHCVRALVKELGVPSLYVQSIKHRYEPEEACLKMVFERARQLRPCVLVIEDLDALITPANRSFFLNQLDGFEKNVGLVVLATTNHPERIDPAILDRPSRFDRKYHFELPALSERRTYLSQWQAKLATKVDWSDGTTEAIAEATAGFSFAYLKELVLASLLKAVDDERTRPFSAILSTECAALAAQMHSRAPEATSHHAPTDVEVDDA